MKFVRLIFVFVITFGTIQKSHAVTTQTIERTIAKTNIILLPIEVSPSLLSKKNLIEKALTASLSSRFNVFYGEPVDKIIEKENLAPECTIEQCVEALVEQLNSEFVVDASFETISDDIVFSLEIRNVLEDKLETSTFETCSNCDMRKLLEFIQRTGQTVQLEQNIKFQPIVEKETPPPAKEPIVRPRETVDFKKVKKSGGMGFGTIGSVLAGLAALGGGGGGGGVSSNSGGGSSTPDPNSGNSGNGGSSTPDPEPDPEPTQVVSGRAIKGPLQDAIAFLDYNDNGIIDEGEPSATTASDGSYSFTVTNADGPVVVLTDGNTVDTSSGEVVSNLVLKAPSGSSVVTPLTTLLEDSNLTETELKDALDIDQSVDLKTADPFSEATDSALATQLEKAALKVVSITRSITAVSDDETVSSKTLSKIAFEAVGEAIKEKLETASSFDFSDDANVAAIRVKTEEKFESEEIEITNIEAKISEALEQSKTVIEQVETITSIEDDRVRNIFRAVTDVNKSVRLLITADADGDGLTDFDDPDSDNDGVPNALDAFPKDPNENEDRDGDGVGANADVNDRDADYFLKVGTNPEATQKLRADDGFIRLVVHQIGSKVNIEVIANYNSIKNTEADAEGIGNYAITIQQAWANIRKPGTEVSWRPNSEYGTQFDTVAFVSDDGVELKGRFSSYSGLARNITSGNISLGVLTFETEEDASELDFEVTDDLTYIETAGFNGLRIFSRELDSDGDGFADTEDLFPNDPSENADLDGDGIGDNSDPDIDGDGVSNANDLFPFDLNESADLDGDGLGDNADLDKDGDGVANSLDAFPEDSTEDSDLDGDGIGDNKDPDRDGDGIANIFDRDDDASGSRDLDGDGIADADDPDRDGDGVLNQDDAFPDDPSKTADSDGDGIADNLDNDRDGDGYADGLDAFPDDPNEHRDTDLDGIGDNQDPVAAVLFEDIRSLSGNVRTIKPADFDTSRFPLSFPVSREISDGLGGISIDTDRTSSNATNLDIDIRSFSSSGDFNLVSIEGYNYASATDPRYAVAVDSYTGAQFTNGSVLDLEDVTNPNGQGNIRFSLFRDDNELPFILMNNLNSADSQNITRFSFFGLVGQSFDDVSVFHDGIKTPKNSLPNSRAAFFRGKSVGKFVDSARAEGSLVTFSDIAIGVNWANETAGLISGNTYAGTFRDTGSYDSFEPEWNQSRQRAPALDFSASMEFIESDEYYFTYVGGTDTHAFGDPESVFYSGASSSIWAAFYGDAAEDIAGSADISQVASDGTGYRYTLAFGSTFDSFLEETTSYADADGDNYFEIASVDDAFTNFDQTGGLTEFIYRPADTNYLQAASYHERHTMGDLDWRSGEMLPVDNQFVKSPGYGDYVFKFDVNPSNGLLRSVDLETDLGEPFARFSNTDSYFAQGLNGTILAPFTNNDDFIVFWSDNQSNVTGGPSYSGFLRGQSLVVNNFTDHNSEITPDHFIFGLYSEAITSTVDQSADLFSEAIYCCEVSSYDDRLNGYVSGIYGTFSGKSLGRYYDIGDDGIPMIDLTTSDILLEFTGGSGTIVSGNTILLDGPIVDRRVEGLDFFGDIRINSALDGRLTVNNSTVEFSGSSKMNSERLDSGFWGGHFFGPDLDEIGMAWSITELIDTAGESAGSNIKRAYLGSFGATRRASKVLDIDGNGVVDFDDVFDDDGDGIPNLFDIAVDTDGDGVVDELDYYPDDPTESANSDGDRWGDNSDPYPGSQTVPLLTRNGLVFNTDYGGNVFNVFEKTGVFQFETPKPSNISATIGADYTGHGFNWNSSLNDIYSYQTSTDGDLVYLSLDLRNFLDLTLDINTDTVNEQFVDWFSPIVYGESGEAFLALSKDLNSNWGVRSDDSGYPVGLAIHNRFGEGAFLKETVIGSYINGDDVYVFQDGLVSERMTPFDSFSGKYQFKGFSTGFYSNVDTRTGWLPTTANASVVVDLDNQVAVIQTSNTQIGSFQRPSLDIREDLEDWSSINLNFKYAIDFSRTPNSEGQFNGSFTNDQSFIPTDEEPEIDFNFSKWTAGFYGYSDALANASTGESEPKEFGMSWVAGFSDPSEGRTAYQNEQIYIGVLGARNFGGSSEVIGVPLYVSRTSLLRQPADNIDNKNIWVNNRSNDGGTQIVSDGFMLLPNLSQEEWFEFLLVNDTSDHQELFTLTDDTGRIKQLTYTFDYNNEDSQIVFDQNLGDDLVHYNDLITGGIHNYAYSNLNLSSFGYTENSFGDELVTTMFANENFEYQVFGLLDKKTQFNGQFVGSVLFSYGSNSVNSTALPNYFSGLSLGIFGHQSSPQNSKYTTSKMLAFIDGDGNLSLASVGTRVYDRIQDINFANATSMPGLDFSATIDAASGSIDYEETLIDDTEFELAHDFGDEPRLRVSVKRYGPNSQELGGTFQAGGEGATDFYSGVFGIKEDHSGDVDGDGVENLSDLFPITPSDFADLDGDGLGNNADNDIDGDGVSNNADPFPYDAAGYSDQLLGDTVENFSLFASFSGNNLTNSGAKNRFNSWGNSFVSHVLDRRYKPFASKIAGGEWVFAVDTGQTDNLNDDSWYFNLNQEFELNNLNASGDEPFNLFMDDKETPLFQRVTGVDLNGTGYAVYMPTMSNGEFFANNLFDLTFGVIDMSGGRVRTFVGGKDANYSLADGGIDRLTEYHHSATFVGSSIGYLNSDNNYNTASKISLEVDFKRDDDKAAILRSYDSQKTNTWGNRAEPAPELDFDTYLSRDYEDRSALSNERGELNSLTLEGFDLSVHAKMYGDDFGGSFSIYGDPDGRRNRDEYGFTYVGAFGASEAIISFPSSVVYDDSFLRAAHVVVSKDATTRASGIQNYDGSGDNKYLRLRVGQSNPRSNPQDSAVLEVRLHGAESISTGAPEYDDAPHNSNFGGSTPYYEFLRYDRDFTSFFASQTGDLVEVGSDNASLSLSLQELPEGFEVVAEHFDPENSGRGAVFNFFENTKGDLVIVSNREEFNENFGVAIRQFPDKTEFLAFSDTEYGTLNRPNENVTMSGYSLGFMFDDTQALSMDERKLTMSKVSVVANWNQNTGQHEPVISSTETFVSRDLSSGEWTRIPGLDFSNLEMSRTGSRYLHTSNDASRGYTEIQAAIIEHDDKAEMSGVWRMDKNNYHASFSARETQ